MANFNPNELRDEKGRWTSALTENNSMRHSHIAPPPLPDLSPLEKAGYRVYPIESLKVLYANPKANNHDLPLSKQRVGEGGYDLVANGTYTLDYKNSAGAIIRNGVFDTTGTVEKPKRGSLAVLKDGTIIIGRTLGCTEADIKNQFGQKDNPVKDFMGGAALLINNGEKVSGRELWQVEKFDNGVGKSKDGFDAAQMRKTYHTVFGIRKGQAYLIVTKTEKYGRNIQEDLIQAEFGSALKLDGGSGRFLNDGKPEHGFKGTNTVGLGIRCRKK